MKADLHVHSYYSDGSDSIKQVMEKAQKNGVTHLSFVDHDTVAGYKEIQELSAIYDVNVIPGIEISAYDFKRNRKVHVLGYHYNPAAVHIQQVCQALLERRQQHSLWQINQINSVGYRLDEAEVMRTANPSKTIYKQHIMHHVTTADSCSPEYQRLYQQLFKQDGIAAGDIEYLSAFEAVEAIVADGGIAVVAHPGQLDSYAIIPELVEVGLRGIELYHPDHTDQDYQKVKSLAKAYDLMMTGGSDYHGSYGNPMEVGSVTSPFNDLLNNCK